MSFVSSSIPLHILKHIVNRLESFSPLPAPNLDLSLLSVCNLFLLDEQNLKSTMQHAGQACAVSQAHKQWLRIASLYSWPCKRLQEPNMQLHCMAAARGLVSVLQLA